LPPLSDGPKLYFPNVIRQKIESWKLPKQYIVLHCCSLDPAKDWGPEKWKTLAQVVHQNFGLTLVEIGLHSALEELGFCDLVNMCSQTSMLEAAAVIERATLFIGIDSGPTHLANAVRCPGVVLLGEYGAFKEYLPYTGFFTEGGATIVRARGPVSSLSVDEVFDAIRDRMRDSASRDLAANPENQSLQTAVSG
jgi:heptosyltransferase-3